MHLPKGINIKIPINNKLIMSYFNNNLNQILKINKLQIKINNLIKANLNLQLFNLNKIMKNFLNKIYYIINLFMIFYYSQINRISKFNYNKLKYSLKI